MIFRKRIIGIAFLFTLSASSDCLASTVYGPGAISCGMFLEHFHESQDGNPVDGLLYLGDGDWILGYLSAKSGAGNLEETDSNGVNQWILNYCQTHPLKRLNDAANALVKELKIKQ